MSACCAVLCCAVLCFVDKQIFHFFGYLWTVEFAKAVGMLTIAGAIASDYWITNDLFRPSMPLMGSFYRSLRYHSGSAAYGAMIIAVIRLIRYVMMYIDHKTQELQKSQVREVAREGGVAATHHTPYRPCSSQPCVCLPACLPA